MKLMPGIIQGTPFILTKVSIHIHPRLGIYLLSNFASGEHYECIYTLYCLTIRPRLSTSEAASLGPIIRAVLHAHNPDCGTYEIQEIPQVHSKKPPPYMMTVRGVAPVNVYDLGRPTTVLI